MKLCPIQKKLVSSLSKITQQVSMSLHSPSSTSHCFFLKTLVIADLLSCAGFSRIWKTAVGDHKFKPTLDYNSKILALKNK